MDSMDKAGFTMIDASSCELITQQKGVFRTNCLDWCEFLRILLLEPLMLIVTPRSLDRTNFVQDIISRVMLEQYLTLIRREWLHSGTLWSYHRELWAENGDALSRIYAGTGALNTSYTRSGKRTLAGTFACRKVHYAVSGLALILLQVSYPMLPKVCLAPTSIIFKIKASKWPSTCSWSVTTFIMHDVLESHHMTQRAISARRSRSRYSIPSMIL